MNLGRTSLFNKLKTNFKGSNVKSYNLYGQKRVGKTSIINTLSKELEKDKSVIVVSVGVQAFINAKAEDTFYDMTHQIIDDFIINYKKKDYSADISNIDKPIFKSGFNPIIRFVKNVRESCEEKFNFILMIDEFDTINTEFLQEDKEPNFAHHYFNF